MNNSNNKETINLLDLLSDTDSDVSDLVLTPKKKKVKRKHRPSGAVKTKQNDSRGCTRSDMRLLSLWLATILVTFWLIALSWLAVVLYGEIKKMDISIKSVIHTKSLNSDAIYYILLKIFFILLCDASILELITERIKITEEECTLTYKLLQ